jgi:hypothetical protein
MRDDERQSARGLGGGVARIIPLRRSALGPMLTASNVLHVTQA